jgi:hypothetical protein
MALPGMPRAELGMLLAGVEQPGLDVGILDRPVRPPGAPLDMGASSVLQPRHQAARPRFSHRTDPRAFDGEQVERAKAVPAGIEAAQHLHEMIEIAAVPFAAAQRPARRQDACGSLVSSEPALITRLPSVGVLGVLSTKPRARNSVSSRMALAIAAFAAPEASDQPVGLARAGERQRWARARTEAPASAPFGGVAGQAGVALGVGLCRCRASCRRVRRRR